MILGNRYILIDRLEFSLMAGTILKKSKISQNDIVKVNYNIDGNEDKIVGTVKSIKCYPSNDTNGMAIFVKIIGCDQFINQIVYVRPDQIKNLVVIKTSEIFINPKTTICMVSDDFNNLTINNNNDIKIFEYLFESIKSNNSQGGTGSQGPKGDPGKDGKDGLSPYQIAVNNGFAGTEEEWLESLKGEDGLSAYESAVKLGFNGTEEEWLESLKGIDGTNGKDGDTPRIDVNNLHWFIGDTDTGYMAVPNVLDVPVLLSQLTNDTNFITNTVNNLINYYAKSEVYTKEEVSTLIGGMNQLKVSIVDILPTEDISSNTIYLISSGDNIYDQHMYISGSWANLGNTSINLDGYAKTEDMQTALNGKSNVDHTHTELHTHDNKSVLDYITSEMVLKWNNSFSGRYADLTGQPDIPVLTNDLTNELKDKYDQAYNNMHTHSNRSVLDKFSESIEGDILYNNEPLTAADGGAGIDDTVTSINKTWSSSKISSDISTVGAIANEISIAQKTVNVQLEYCFGSLMTNPSNQENLTITTNVNDTIKFIPYINKDIMYNSSTWSYTLKASKTYSIEALVRISGVEGKYFYINIYDKTNSRWIGTDGLSAMTTSLSQSIFQSTCVITPTTDIEVCVKVRSGNTTTATTNTSYFIIQEIGRSTTIDPVEYVNTVSGIEDTPVGHILSQMGKTAPKHYLICDGSTYNITDYPYLSQYIKDQFGTFNFFGGDGTTTFAVPDLRNEFLRGYHGEKSEQLSGEIGVHQSATSVLNTVVYLAGSSGNFLPYYNTANGASGTQNPDSVGQTAVGRMTVSGTLDTSVVGQPGAYTTRPTNNAVLYCIKYEPTYFMNIQGMIEETVLWEGKVGSNSSSSVSNSTALSDSLLNYDKIQFCLVYDSGTSASICNEEITPNNFNQLLNYTYTNAFISYVSPSGSSSGYANILKTSTGTNLQWTLFKYYVTKIVGIKYKTFQNSGSGDGESYTDEEIREYVEGILNGN